MKDMEMTKRYNPLFVDNKPKEVAKETAAFFSFAPKQDVVECIIGGPSDPQIPCIFEIATRTVLPDVRKM